MGYTKECGEYLSADKKTKIKYMLFTPEEPPKGIIQTLHGLGSSFASYEASGFVEKLTSAGFVVCGEDHLGHGGSVESRDDYGHLDSYEHLITDVHSLKDIVRERYKYLPYIMYGHSFGSMILRGYIARYNDISGAVISGTCQKSDRYKKLIRQCKRKIFFKGVRFRCKKLDAKLFEGFNDSFSEENDSVSWLSSLSEVRRKYREGNGGMAMTLGGYREFAELANFVTSDIWLQSIPLSLPVFIISGEDDPLGGMGKGIKELHSTLIELGLSSVKMKLYTGSRHQILKDRCRDEVFGDVIGWANEVIAAVNEEMTMSIL